MMISLVRCSLLFHRRLEEGGVHISSEDGISEVYVHPSSCSSSNSSDG